MPLNINLLCQTSGWHNNCGLNGLSNFLAQKLVSGELIKKFSHDLNYIAILDSFKEYYDLPKRPTWEEIRTLFNKYPAATDREAIFSPVLRKYLGKVILPKAEGLWDFHGAGALTDYLKGTPASDIAQPIIHSNEAWFRELKQQYDREFSQKVRKNASENERFRASNVLLEKIQGEAKAKWMEEGCEAYAERMSELQHNEMVSSEQLLWIGEALGIGIEIYSGRETQVPQWESEENLPWELKFHNAAGGHWKFEEPNQDNAAAIAHNQHYLPDEFYQEEEDAYFENDALSGKFKIYAGRGEGKEEFIKDAVRSEMIKRPKPILVAETEKTAQVSMNQLIDKLEHLLQEKKITEKQQKKIFEQYFDKFQEALGQKTPAASKRAVDKIVKEVNQIAREENEENEPPAKKRRKI